MHRSETCSKLSVFPEGQAGNISHGEPFRQRSQLQDIRNINVPSRFKTGKAGAKGKTVRLPGKKSAANKVVFQQRSNICDEPDGKENTKRLKARDYRLAECTEMKASEKGSSNPFKKVSGNDGARKGQENRNNNIVTTEQRSCKGVPKPSKSGKHGRPRPPMPNIPIPALSLHSL